jgi:2,3-bisphosphoglycerate-dependent phosphoglycerate mutase
VLPPERAAAPDARDAALAGAGEGDHPTTVVLVRHGEAICNVEGVIGGRRGCTGLTGRGRAQVEALASRLMETGELGAVGALYTSPLRRAVETAEILAPALGRRHCTGGLEPAVDGDLCELRPGVADGLSWAVFAERYGEPDWDRDPGAVIAPGGESWEGFVARAAAAVARLASAHPGETVVLACHAGVVESTILRLLPVDPAVTRLGLATAHASLTVWERAAGRWRLGRYNDRVSTPAPG